MPFSTSPSSPIAGEGKQFGRTAKRRGLTLRHWLLIFIFTALAADVTLRVVALRKPRGTGVTTAPGQTARNQVRGQLLERATQLELERRRSIERRKLLEESLKRQLPTIPEPIDPERGNIILL
jgi:hypothetical protein